MPFIQHFKHWATKKKDKNMKDMAKISSEASNNSLVSIKWTPNNLKTKENHHLLNSIFLYPLLISTMELSSKLNILNKLPVLPVMELEPKALKIWNLAVHALEKVFLFEKSKTSMDKNFKLKQFVQFAKDQEKQLPSSVINVTEAN